MKLVSVCVAVGAISFVGCDLVVRGDAATQPPDEWNAKSEGARPHERAAREAIEGSDPTKSRPEAESVPGVKKIEEFLRGSRHPKRIFESCREEANRRPKTPLEGKQQQTPEVGGGPSNFGELAASLYDRLKAFVFRSPDRVPENDRVPRTDAPPGAAGHALAVLDGDRAALVRDGSEGLPRSHSLDSRLDRGVVLQGRGRRRDHRMFAMMVMGFMIMASILIPMGFQFLTVLGGKSLLMAKMALIMSAISGLKKIATSNVGYGFYHTGSDGHHHDHLHHGFHEKQLRLGPNAPPQYGFDK